MRTAFELDLAWIDAKRDETQTLREDLVLYN